MDLVNTVAAIMAAATCAVAAGQAAAPATMHATPPGQPDASLVPMLEARGYRPIARIRPRTAKEIGTSPWSIGAETLDRDYVDFAQIAPHFAELGATQVRLQGGWAKCDPGTGQYNWAWLDTIVDTCLAQGVRPWIETSYGNPKYPGGGGIGLSEGIPTSPEALAAWDRWVRALVERYRDRVDAWEIWNEPDLNKVVTPEAYTAFFIRTATTIRSAQPKARIIGLALCHEVDGFAATFLRDLAAAGQADLLSEVSFHMYPHNPDDSFDRVARLAELVKQYAPHATLRQGETGAPSETQRFMAMGDFDWSERKQVAWDLRRLLAHHARGYPMSLFQMADMYYSKKAGIFEGRNPKGMLAIRNDKTVAYRKPVYFAAQHVFSILDGGYPVVALENLAKDRPERTSAYLWQRDGKPALLAWWRSDVPPGLAAAELTSLQLPVVPFNDPVLLDFASGMVFSFSGDWAKLPLTDSPLAIAERSVLPLTKE